MSEDRLTRNERIRLEALSQSMQITALTSTKRPTISEVLQNAEHIEKWLKKADLTQN